MPINGEPQVVDITWYAGDTLTIKVTVPTDFIAGRDWLAQIRSTADAAVIDAVFAVTLPVVQDGPAYLTLSAAETARLQQGAPPGRSLVPRTVTAGKYTGTWDCQLAPPGGGDPVKTIAKGALAIVGDVSRLP